jgi:hypothetical protein
MDRELLELAAKAAGIEIHSYDPISDRIYTPRSLPMLEGSYLHTWNPLTDDGDALRLMVHLNMNLDVVDASSGAQVLHVAWCSEPHHDDPLAATRRAITRAAAEIGRSMK